MLHFDVGEKKYVTEVIQLKYIKIFLSFQCKLNVSKCNKNLLGT